ncbi:helix-turn-helix domain-containing protein [Dictyobacter kobayashii]|uniref:AraC family transcriptional regulator n=1 Tax=Dictyobacter kobayashii TaxID=2014872 RepID=A0A402ATT0_9CHLR|nr:helix-turn-helix domain-containing protein [Dictyobacter kobayashii]GCE22521.1 AraC family transcriptional regulator [Dictyobacter kobayashii]
MQRRKQILHFDDINHSHEIMGFSGRTDLPDFHVYTLEETYPSTRQVMPPYTLRFYCLLLLEENSQDAVIELNTERLAGPSNTISFQSPGHVSAWIRGEAQKGFLLYFQPEFLSQYVVSLLEDFPFFRPTELHILPLTSTEKATLRDHFLRLERTFKNKQHPYRVPMLQGLLLTLLFDCKGLYESYCTRQAHSSIHPSLAAQFLQALEQHYLTQRTVQAYADLLHVTPNHLSHAISNEIGRKAYDLIVDRVLLEAKKLLYYTDLSVGEIANYLGFEEATHFTRLFKRKLALTPLEYRHHATKQHT